MPLSSVYYAQPFHYYYFTMPFHHATPPFSICPVCFDVDATRYFTPLFRHYCSSATVSPAVDPLITPRYYYLRHTIHYYYTPTIFIIISRPLFFTGRSTTRQDIRHIRDGALLSLLLFFILAVIIIIIFPLHYCHAMPDPPLIITMMLFFHYYYCFQRHYRRLLRYYHAIAIPPRTVVMTPRYQYDVVYWYYYADTILYAISRRFSRRLTFSTYAPFIRRHYHAPLFRHYAEILFYYRDDAEPPSSFLMRITPFPPCYAWLLLLPSHHDIIDIIPTAITPRLIIMVFARNTFYIWPIIIHYFTTIIIIIIAFTISYHY